MYVRMYISMSMYVYNVSSNYIHICNLKSLLCIFNFRQFLKQMDTKIVVSWLHNLI